MSALAHLPQMTVTAAIWVSVGFALACLGVTALLCLRRFVDERRAPQLVEGDKGLLGLLLQAMEEDTDEPAQERTLALALRDNRRARRVFSHLFLLVRGHERERLIALAQRHGVAERLLREVTHRNLHRRVDAMRALEHLPVEDAQRAVTRVMSSDPSPRVRLEAAAILARNGTIPGPAYILWALDLPARTPTRLHMAMLRVAAQSHGDELVRLCHAQDFEHVRALLVEALGWSNDFSHLAVLEGMAGAADPAVRSAALKAALQMGHPGAAPWVMACLCDPIAFVRLHAARACGKLGIEAAIPLLTGLLHDRSWWVRMRSAQALHALRPAQPLPLSTIGLRR
ncbi:HEAT repeat domain-containing protein [Novosphingobium profundi]|uniref:HEAT repeat domain-containing protein n=1 Tax=Novosphingobium profundi TaxID=1774954 RepID=UPI001BD983CA|nr:HEAT repeat domain-containing protein [Novosphingobium profundi]